MQPLLHINWNITYRCPLSCAHCYSRLRGTGRELGLEEKLAVARNIIRGGIFSVNLGGGEPIFSPDVPEVLKALSGAGVWTTLCTSGWKVGERDVARVADAGLKAAFISLDDDRPERHDAMRGAPGCFDDAAAAAGLFARRGIEVGISTVVTRENLPRLGRMVELARGLGAASIEFKRLKPQGNGSGLRGMLLEADDEDELFSSVAALKAQGGTPSVTLIYGPGKRDGIDEGCPCAKTILTILDDGTVAPCVYNPQPVGNALEDDLMELWSRSDALRRFREEGTCAGLAMQ